MRMILLMVVVVLSGCVSGKRTFDSGMVYESIGEACAFETCSRFTRVHYCDGKASMSENGTYVCVGNMSVTPPYPTQTPGIVTQFLGVVIPAAAMVGTGVVVADGIRDSASETNVNQQGGGATASNQNENLSLNSNNSSASGGVGIGNASSNSSSRTFSGRPNRMCD